MDRNSISLRICGESALKEKKREGAEKRKTKIRKPLILLALSGVLTLLKV